MRAIATPASQQQEAFLEALLDPSIGCMELRVLKATTERDGMVVRASNYPATYGGWTIDPTLISRWSSKLRGVSAYVTVNPADLALLARSNKFEKQPQATADSEIVCLRWAFLDIDPKRPSGISATEDERQAALECCYKILTDHDVIRESSIWGCSGNGAFVLVRLPDYPNDAGHKALVERFLKALAARYSGEYRGLKVEVDPATFNPARIMALVGTMKCKGVNTPERPHRLVTLDSPLDTKPTPFDLRGWLTLHAAEEKPGTQPTNGKAHSSFTKKAKDDSGAGVHYPKPGSVSVFDDFDAKTKWFDSELLGDVRIDKTLANGELQLTRPGKDDDVSGTIGHEGRDVFKCFSANWTPFEAGGCYSKFQVYALRHHGGDPAKAAAALEAGGFGTYIDHDGSEKQNPPPADWAQRNKASNSKPSSAPSQTSGSAPIDYAALSDEELGIIPAGSVKERPIEWLWPYRFAVGEMALLAGDGGLGKSSLLLAIAGLITRGAAWPDKSGRAPIGDVLIVSAEDSRETTLKPRLLALQADLDRVTFITARKTIVKPGKPPMVDPMTLQELGYWREILRRFPACKLLIIDPIPSYLGRGVNDSKNNELRSVIEPFIETVVRPAGVCFAANSHLNKNADSKTPIHRIMGSMAYGALPRNVHFILRDPDKPDRRLFKQAKCNNAPEDLPAVAYSLIRADVPSAAGDIETSFPVFEAATVEVDLQEAMGGGKSKPGLPKVLSLAKWLLDYLRRSGNPIQKGVIYDAAGDAGHIGEYGPTGKDRKLRWVDGYLLKRAFAKVPSLQGDDAGWMVEETQFEGRGYWQAIRADSLGGNPDA